MIYLVANSRLQTVSCLKSSKSKSFSFSVAIQGCWSRCSCSGRVGSGRDMRSGRAGSFSFDCVFLASQLSIFKAFLIEENFARKFSYFPNLSQFTSNIFPSVIEFREATDPRSSMSPTVAASEARSSSIPIPAVTVPREEARELIGLRSRGISTQSLCYCPEHSAFSRHLGKQRVEKISVFLSNSRDRIGERD